MKVIVYLKAKDERDLEAEGQDPAGWVRQAVKDALATRRSQAEQSAWGPEHPSYDEMGQ